MSLRVACAWCLEEITPGDEPTSHGICARCSQEHFPEEPSLLEEDTPMRVKDLVSRLLDFDMDALVVLDLRKESGLCSRSHIYKVQDDALNTGVVSIVESARLLTEADIQALNHFICATCGADCGPHHRDGWEPDCFRCMKTAADERRTIESDLREDR